MTFMQYRTCVHVLFRFSSFDLPANPASELHVQPQCPNAHDKRSVAMSQPLAHTPLRHDLQALGDNSINVCGLRCLCAATWQSSTGCMCNSTGTPEADYIWRFLGAARLRKMFICLRMPVLWLNKLPHAVMTPWLAQKMQLYIPQ